MMQKMRILFLVCITTVLAACGGDGGTSNEPVHSFVGSYIVNLTNTRTSSSCGDQGWPRNLTLAQSVSQNGSNIVLTTDAGLIGEKTFLGMVHSNNSSFATMFRQVINVQDRVTGVVSAVDALSTMSYTKNPIVGIYSVVYDIEFSNCSYTYSGAANRK
jgi:hypothetical protein